MKSSRISEALRTSRPSFMSPTKSSNMKTITEKTQLGLDPTQTLNTSLLGTSGHQTKNTRSSKPTRKV